MLDYEVTFTATVKIKATNAVAAKYAVEREMNGRKLVRLGGAHSGSGPAPSGKGSRWRWRVRVADEKITGLKRT